MPALVTNIVHFPPPDGISTAVRKRNLFIGSPISRRRALLKAEPGCVLELEQIKLAFIWRPLAVWVCRNPRIV